jgi:hypothetical protein
LISTIILGVAMSGCNSVPEDWGTANPDYLVLIEASSCWNDICPGQTTREEADQLLRAVTFGEEIEVDNRDSENSLVLSLDNHQFEGSWVRVKFDMSGQVVRSVRIILGKNELTMEQVVNVLGEPQQVVVEAHSIGDSAASYISYEMWYPELGLFVSSGIYNAGHNPMSSQIILHPTLATKGFEYMGVEEGKEQLLEHLMIGFPSFYRPKDKQELEKFFHPWPGFDNSVPSFLDYGRYRP